MEFPENIMTSPSIPMTYSRVAARALGLSERRLYHLMMGTGVSARELLRDELYLTGRQQIQLLCNALDIAGDESFGLHFGRQLKPLTHGPLGFLVNSSYSLQGALESFRDYLPLRMSLTAITLHKSDEWLDCELHICPGVDQKVCRLFVEALSLGTLAIAESILGRELTEGHLWLTYPAPPYHQRYRDIYPCAVSFSAKRNLLRIPVALANTLNVSADPGNYELALERCRALLREIPAEPDSTQLQVRRLLLSSPNHQLTEVEVAKALFVSKRTLTRRLASEGCSYKDVRDEVLSSLAKGHLLGSSLSVEAIASLLNYHDSANFRRAFKRWFHVTPSEFRRKNMTAQR